MFGEAGTDFSASIFGNFFTKPDSWMSNKYYIWGLITCCLPLSSWRQQEAQPRFLKLQIPRCGKDEISLAFFVCLRVWGFRVLGGVLVCFLKLSCNNARQNLQNRFTESVFLKEIIDQKTWDRFLNCFQVGQEKSSSKARQLKDSIHLSYFLKLFPKLNHLFPTFTHWDTWTGSRTYNSQDTLYCLLLN